MKPKKQKSPGLVVNKTAEIRRVASLLVSQGELPRPKTIRDRLAGEGIVVTSPQVSMGLTNTEFAYRRNQTPQRPQFRLPDPLEALGRTGMKDLGKAKEFISDMGGIEKAIVAIVAASNVGTDEKQNPPEQTEDYYAGA